MIQHKLRSVIKHLAPPLMGLSLLAGMAAQQLSYTTPEDVTGYHRRVARAVEAVPMRIGPWRGAKQDVPRAAVKLLSPNVILSRRYHNPETGRTVSLMMVHCKDARDLTGHYPPICYPANGWTLQHQADRTWAIAGHRVPVRAYRFRMDLPTAERAMRVLNTLVLPDGTLTREMGQVRDVAADYRSHFYGAGQMQLIVSARLNTERRKQLFARFYRAVHPAIRAIRSGPTHNRE